VFVVSTGVARVVTVRMVAVKSVVNLIFFGNCIC
jgi:hypothetical protein